MTTVPYRGEARFRVRYDEPMLRDAVRSFIWRKLVRQQPFFWTVELVMVAMVAQRLFQGRGDWLSFLILGVILLPLLILGGIWWAHHTRTIGQFQSLSPPEADVFVDEEGSSFASSLGKATLPWDRLTTVWRRPGYWMLFWGPSEFNTLPDGPLPEDLRAVLGRLAR